MNAKHLVAAAAASLLLGGAAYAQGTGETPNRATPADPTQSQTGVPSVDSSRPTGQDAGKTMLPGGKVGTDADTSVSGTVTPGDVTAGSAPSATTGVSASASTDVSAGASTGVAAGASATTQMVTNGPVPDTPENRAKYGQPLSRAGKMTKPAGN